jgi:hypothetical protein
MRCRLVDDDDDDDDDGGGSMFLRNVVTNLRVRRHSPEDRCRENLRCHITAVITIEGWGIGCRTACPERSFGVNVLQNLGVHLENISLWVQN